MAVNRRESEDFGPPMTYDPDFNGPLKNRSCTDVICMFLFLIFIACWIAVGIYAFKNGNRENIVAPMDSSRSYCGIDTHVIDKPYLFFFDLTKCLQPIPFHGCNTPQICVKECPKNQFLLDTVTNYNPSDMLCVNGVPTPRTKQEAMQMVREGKCAQWYLPSESVLKRCLYNVGDRRLLHSDVSKIKGDEISLMQHYLETSITWLALTVQNAISIFTDNEHALQVGNNIVDDLIKSWWKILLGLVCALFICIIYIVIMRWIAGIMVWISIFGVIVSMGVTVYICAKNYHYYKENPIVPPPPGIGPVFTSTKGAWLAYLILSSILLGVILLLLFFLRKRIVIAIALIKEASRAVSSATSSLFFPVFPWCLQIGIILYAVFVGIYLTTIGSPLYQVQNLEPATCKCTGLAESYVNGAVCDPEIFLNYCVNPVNSRPCEQASCHFIQRMPPSGIPYLHTINVVGFFWSLFFVSALAEMVLAATFATWYWTFNKGDVPFFTVTEATLRTFRYHIGTLAYGSLILSICRIIRVALESINSTLNKYDNFCTKMMLCCCRCFFWCLENFIKFLNKNAYIMCAIHGTNFCTSAKDAFNLLMRNILRVAVLDKVTDLLFLLSKILVTAGVTCIAYLIFIGNSKQSDLNYNFIPVVIIGIGTFFIASVFFSVFSMAVDTLFLCFLEDSERNDGSAEKPYYMSKNLMSILGKKNK